MWERLIKGETATKEKSKLGYKERAEEFKKGLRSSEFTREQLKF